MVTFLPPLNSADILIFHRRSIFRSLIFGPDFPNFLSTLNVSSFLQSTEGSSENEGIGRVCMGWPPICLDQAEPDISFRQAAAAPDPSFLSSGISARQQQLRWHFSEVSSANIVPPIHPTRHPISESQNERSDSNWGLFDLIYSDQLR